MNRRKFLKTALLGALASVLRACGVRTGPTAPRPTEPPFAKPPQTPDFTPAPPGAATPAATPAILQNENREGFYIRYYRPFPAPDRSTWRLRVEGLVKEPLEFDYATILEWPSESQVSRMKCVECWSAKAKWEGFRYNTLAEMVSPSPLATHVRFECADGYWEILSIEELRHPRVLFVTKMNDELLTVEHGAPLRMIVPWEYGYKGAKAITVLRFQAEGGAGYWPTVGPYTVDGHIQPGYDHPLDFPGEQRQIGEGEITEY